MIDLMQTITSLGDSGLLLPASLCILAYLLYKGAHSVALIWTAVLAVGLGTTLVAKLGFHACGVEIGLPDVRSPSGHTAFGAIFFGCAGLLAGFGRPKWQRIAILGGAVTLILLIALSRVTLRAHTPEEVVGGLLIGGLSVAFFAWAHARAKPPEIRLRPVVVAFAALVVLLNGHSLNAEPLIRDIAYKLRSTMNVCAPSPDQTALN
jgi:membrane-associated phospholipid phosphatase